MPLKYKTLPRIARQQLQKMARNRPFYPHFPCFLVPSPNQKRFFSVFKVSLNIMRQSDLASADVEFRKSDKKLHLSGAPDCPVEQPAVWSFFQTEERLSMQRQRRELGLQNILDFSE